jgi:hypothetical protein
MDVPHIIFMQISATITDKSGFHYISANNVDNVLRVKDHYKTIYEVTTYVLGMLTNVCKL